MARRGRKPKPTALKILDGTRRDRINEHEPSMAPSGIDPPGYLRNLALEHWRELAPMLLGAGLLSVGDRAALAQLCQAYQTIRDDPLDAKTQVFYLRLLTEFGLTPSSRSRIKSTAEPAKDALGEFLARRK